MTSSTDHDRLSAAPDRAQQADDRAEGDRLILSESALIGDSATIPVVQEFATVGVERRETGGVRVRIETRPADENLSVDLVSENVEVTRRPMGHEIDAIPEPRQEGDLLIVPVVEERAVIVTKLFLTEEIHIRRLRSTETVDVPVNLRRQHAVVEQLETGLAEPGTPAVPRPDDQTA